MQLALQQYQLQSQMILLDQVIQPLVLVMKIVTLAQPLVLMLPALSFRVMDLLSQPGSPGTTPPRF